MESVGRALAGPLRSVNDKGDSWRCSISIRNRPRSYSSGKEVISNGKGDRSVVGHFWRFSRSGGGYYTNGGRVLEGLLYDWQGNER